MRAPTTPAGGRATEAGMSFQAAVGAWFTAHLAADMPVGGRFGLAPAARVQRLECETGETLDDLVITLDSGGKLYVQCKTTVTLAAPTAVAAYAELSPLGKTIYQLVELWRGHRDEALANCQSVAVLAVRSLTGPLGNLETGCRLFDAGGDWPSLLGRGSASVRDALQIFAGHVQVAWSLIGGGTPTNADLAQLARLLRIRDFSEDDQGADWREARNLVGRRLYLDEAAGERPMRTIVTQVRRLIGSGAPMERPSLIRALREAGHNDVGAPGFDEDIRRLRAASDHELLRLAAHHHLPIENVLPITREVLAPLATAVREGSLLVTGDPGAGKTGVLLALAADLRRAGNDVIFLSVDRFAGVQGPAGLQQDLELTHGLLQVLANWPGNTQRILLIDALDASRGGPAEIVISQFIADTLRDLRGSWSIVASIRSFDLRNGQRFRALIPGTPPAPKFAEAGLGAIRHIHVSMLSDCELASVALAAPQLAPVLNDAPPGVRGLLRNIFNLSLAAELLGQGITADDIRSIATQSELIKRYETVRLSSHDLEMAARDAVATMVRETRLSVRRINVGNPAVNEVQQNGVLVADGDRIAFAHHILFDHVAGRFFLRWDNLSELETQLSATAAAGFLLGPALRFALEIAWKDDMAGRPQIWRFLERMAAGAEADPVVVTVALRTAADQVEGREDVTGLRAAIADADSRESAARLVGRIAGFLRLRKQQTPLSTSAAVAWAEVAEDLANGSTIICADAARILLHVLAEGEHTEDRGFQVALGRAARQLLARTWTQTSPNSQLVTTAIRLVVTSFGSDPAASRELLERILVTERMVEHAAVEAPCLAEGMATILPHDPDFVVQIYETLFTFEVTDVTASWFGGAASQILPITSTRKQDYEWARWQLTENLVGLLRSSPTVGLAAVISAICGLAHGSTRGGRALAETVEEAIGDRTVRLVNDYLTLQDWRQNRDARHADEDGVLGKLADFLEEAPDTIFREAVEYAFAHETPASVWARLLGIAADRPAVADDLLWPIATARKFMNLHSLTRDAVIYLAAAYPRIADVERRSFEERMQADFTISPADTPQGSELDFLHRLLSEVNSAYIVTDALRTLQLEWQAADELIGNPPMLSVWASERSADEDDLVRSILREDGVDLDRQPDQAIRDTSRAVELFLKEAPDVAPEPTGEAATPEALAAHASLREAADAAEVVYIERLWAVTARLVNELEAPAATEAQTQILRSSVGALAQAVAAIACRHTYAPDRGGRPSLDELIRLTQALVLSPYPLIDPDTNSSRLMWGGWDVRVYAAEAAMALASRFADSRPELSDVLAGLLNDPAPTVRLQVAHRLSALWDVARPTMWTLIDALVERETHEEVLASFIGSTLERIAGRDPERAMHILDRLLEREWVSLSETNRNARDRDAEAAARLVTRLAFRSDQRLAWVWIERWSGDLERGERYLPMALADIRRVLFFAFGQEPTPFQLGMAARARRILDTALRGIPGVLDEAHRHLQGSPDAITIATWQPRYFAADRVLDQACKQLFFGAGAFHIDQHDEPPGLSSAEVKRQFIADFADILAILARHAQPRTVHTLVQLLGFLVEGDPGVVFNRLADVLLNQGAQGGYQTEQLAVGELVTLVRRYLADHRDIFTQDAARRDELVRVIGLFAQVGWPDALQLLFELPDLLR